METAGENSGALCHERHVGDGDESDTAERERAERRMCVPQEWISMPPVGMNVTGSSL